MFGSPGPPVPSWKARGVSVAVPLRLVRVVVVVVVLSERMRSWMTGEIA